MLEKRIKWIVVLLLLVCLFDTQVFAGFFAKNKNIFEGPLTVFVKQEFTRPPGEENFFQKGAVSRLVFVIENTSNDYIVIRSFSILEQLPDINRWYGSVYGGVKYKPLEDAWEFSELDQCLSEPVFAKGVIYPGGKLDVVRYAILREDKVAVTVSYQKLSQNEAKEFLYLYAWKRGEFSVHRKFKHYKNISSVPAGEIDWGMVIFPEAKKIAFMKQLITCKVFLRDPEFTLRDAEEKAGIKADAFVYVNKLRSWVIAKDRGRYLINHDKIIKLPEIDLLSFVVIESTYKTTNFILPLSGYERFHAVQPKVEGPGYFNPGVTPLKENEIVPLLEFAREKGDAVSVLAYDPTGLGKRFYLLVGAFDEKKRRDIAVKKR